MALRGSSAFGLLVFVLAGPVLAQSEVAERAQAVLQARCYECHGSTQHRNGLRLDLHKAALLGGDSGLAAIVPGDAARSLLIQKVMSPDPKTRMPKNGDPLSAAELDLLRVWIDGGAVWPVTDAQDRVSPSAHWSFVPPTKSRVGGIDAFVEASLDAQGLTPKAEADRYTLIRRAHLELTGLPPSPEAVLAFANDSDPRAYARLVDRLFASPHYGERQARRWLDAARYADTNGFEKDRPRSIWPYRDWVIDAFNANMPYNQFVIEQVAGDLLPNATESQRIATGFHRNTMFNEEGGIDTAEDWYKRTLDRTNTTGTVFLGLTVGCAQCHTHKYDPMTQREYFQLFSFFNDAQELTVEVFDEDVARAREEWAAELAALERTILDAGRADAEVQADYAAWSEETAAKASPWTVVRPVSMTSQKGADLTLLEDGSVLVSGDTPNDDVTVLEFDSLPEGVTALRLEALSHESLQGDGPGRGTIFDDGDFFLSKLEAETVAGEQSATPVSFASATHSFAADDRSAELALDGRLDSGWSVRGATGRPHQAVFVLESPLTAEGATFRLTLTQVFIHQHTLGRFRISVTERAAPVVVAGVPAEVERAIAEGRDEDEIRAHYLLEVAPGLATQREERVKLIAARPAFPETLVMTQHSSSRQTRIQRRGEFGRPGRKVDFGVPAVLPPLPEHAPKDRLTLARWIVADANPLTARVAMNRLWQHVFGRGLVTTPEDFGIRGDAPSHPELLEWLAVEFMESDWDLRELHRLMVMSEAFRRDSGVSAEHLERDPDNVYLARGPRFRLDAEVIRDLALAAGGLLNPAIGGPSVFPPQPEGVNALAYGKPQWPTSRGSDRYRRGMYTYLKRAAPYATAATFDAPPADEACVMRRRTNTPLQALTLLNDKVFLEAAQGTAVRVARHRGGVNEKIEYLYMLCLSRKPDAGERVQVAAFYKMTLARLADEPERAWDIAGPIGWFEADRIAEVGAWAAVCRVVLNLDETVTQG